jgi:hypothetical protein
VWRLLLDGRERGSHAPCDGGLLWRPHKPSCCVLCCAVLWRLLCVHPLGVVCITHTRAQPARAVLCSACCQCCRCCTIIILCASMLARVFPRWRRCCCLWECGRGVSSCVVVSCSTNKLCGVHVRCARECCGLWQHLWGVAWCGWRRRRRGCVSTTPVLAPAPPPAHGGRVGESSYALFV